jgi:hypothetical protein
MTFIEQAELAENGEFQARVRQAAITAAVAVVADRPANTPQAIEAHAKRVEWARRILNDPTSYQRALAMSVASNPGLIGGSALDSDIQYTVNTMLSSWAGVTLEPTIS